MADELTVDKKALSKEQNAKVHAALKSAVASELGFVPVHHINWTHLDIIIVDKT